MKTFIRDLPQSELLSYYYRVRDKLLVVPKETAEHAALSIVMEGVLGYLNPLHRIVADPVQEIPRGVREGSILVVDSSFTTTEAIANFEVELIVQATKNIKIVFNVPWATLDTCSPTAYVDIARAFGFADRPQMAQA